MTKRATPRANTVQVVEIDAMDVMEWQHGQRTPQANDANLAALVRQSAQHESAPVVEPARPPLVPRARVTEAPPVPAMSPRAGTALGTGARKPIPRVSEPLHRPSDLPGKPRSAFPAIATPVPTEHPAETQAPAPEQTPQRRATTNSRPSRPMHSPDIIPMSVSGYPVYHVPASGSSDEHPALIPPPELAQALRGQHGQSSIGEPQPGMAPMPAPAPFESAPYDPTPFALSGRASSPELRGEQVPAPRPELRADHTQGEGRRRGANRRLLWLGGAGGLAAALVAVLAIRGGSTDAPSPAPVASEQVAAATQPAAAPEAVGAAPAAVAPAAIATSPMPSPPVKVATAVQPAAPSPAHPASLAVAAAIPSPAHPAPHVVAHPAARRASKKVVVDYQAHGDETPVPSLVAQASEDPAIARARTAYLLGNDKLFAGDAAAATAAYREALGVYPGYVGGYRGLGLAYAQLGETKKALEALKAYVAAVPNARDAPLIKKRIAHLQGR